MAAQEMVNVLCMKWGTKYSADYVNTLYSMVARNMSRDFRFVEGGTRERGTGRRKSLGLLVVRQPELG